MTIHVVDSGAGGHNCKFRRGQRKQRGKEVIGNLLELLRESFVEPPDIREVYDSGIVTDGAFGASVQLSGTWGSQQVHPTIYNFMTLSEAMKDTPYANHMVCSAIGGVAHRGNGHAWWRRNEQERSSGRGESGLPQRNLGGG